MSETYAEALLEERRGYELTGNKGRVAQVDAELKSLGLAVETPEQHDPAVETPETKPRGRARKAAKG